MNIKNLELIKSKNYFYYKILLFPNLNFVLFKIKNLIYMVRLLCVLL